MPVNKHRIDVALPVETKQYLESLRREYRDKTGKSVSMSRLISDILKEYLNKLPEDTG